MKVLSTVSLLLFSHLALSEGLPECIPAYHITGSVADKNLAKTEAVFAFTFYQQHNTSSGLTQSDVPVSGPVKLSYNGIEKTVTPNSKGRYDLKLKPGKYVFQFFYTSKYQEIVTDSIEVKPAYRTSINVKFPSSEIHVICLKPVIYLYPTTPMDVAVQLDTKHAFDFTYPAYNNGWNVKAYPDGILEQGNKQYNYLFWEGPTQLTIQDVNSQEGFLVMASELTGFFEEKLSQLGLNSREIQDYITFWVPKMQEQPKHYIHFVLNEEFNRYAQLTISPKPDKVLRVFMLTRPVNENEKIQVKAQQLPGFTREGFTVIEWGGTVIEAQPTLTTIP